MDADLRGHVDEFAGDRTIAMSPGPSLRVAEPEEGDLSGQRKKMQRSVKASHAMSRDQPQNSSRLTRILSSLYRPETEKSARVTPRSKDDWAVTEATAQSLRVQMGEARQYSNFSINWIFLGVRSKASGFI